MLDGVMHLVWFSCICLFSFDCTVAQVGGCLHHECKKTFRRTTVRQRRYLLSTGELQERSSLLAALSGLTFLSLEDDHLAQAQTGPFLSSLASLKELKHLEVSKTALRDDEMRALAAGIHGLSGLQTLRLFRCIFSAQCCFASIVLHSTCVPTAPHSVPSN
jgi:hypothetical protein